MEIRHQNMTLVLDEQGRQTRLYPGTGRGCAAGKEQPFPTVLFSMPDRAGSFGNSTTQGYSPACEELQFLGLSGETLSYRHPNGLLISQRYEPVQGAAAWRVHTKYENTGDAPLSLTNASAYTVQGMCADGLLSWEDKAKCRIHTCTQAWNGEGQWHASSPEALGIYHTSMHPTLAAFELSSVGSWSTGRFYPTILVEDMELNEIWYFSIETSGNWHFEVGNRGGWIDGSGSLYVSCDCADERAHGWTLTLQPGESWSSPVAVMGCCEGGFTSAVAELTQYRRTLTPPNPWKEDCAVLFNDYMNALWADPTLENEIPLIDAAAAVGCEMYCIDSGWYCALDRDWGGGMGDWIPSADRFGDKGLKWVLDYIRAKGMHPGIWLEIEVSAHAAAVSQRPDDWFLTRNGARVGQGNRYFLNFANPEVRAYLHAVVDRLCALGCEYFKNDYNASIQNGCDNFGTSAAEGLNRHLEAFYSWIDEVRERHPGVMLESCGSGAMRSDACALSHSHIQSVSDQENYTYMPSVLTGSLCNILPEQLGIWAYPYPMLFNQKKQDDLLRSEAFRAAMADGEQTIFNLVNGLCGRLYLSGRIDLADAVNTELTAEGVAVYKAERGHTAASVPVLPLGHKDYCDQQGFTALGLKNGNRMTLAVWRLGGDESCVRLPIAAKSVRTLYPSARPVEYTLGGEHFTVRLPKPFSARFLEVLL